MNNERRIKLSQIGKKLDALRDQIEEIKYEEQDAFDALNEGLQSTARGQQMEIAISCMEDAIDSVDVAIEALEEAAV